MAAVATDTNEAVLAYDELRDCDAHEAEVAIPPVPPFKANDAVAAYDAL